MIQSARSETADLDALYEANRVRLGRSVATYLWLRRIRPQFLAMPLYRLFGAFERRAIIRVEGMKLYIDPFTLLGYNLLAGGFEPQMFDMLKKSLKPGDCFLDIGANEGVFSAFAATQIGKDGYVIAVDPQHRLLSILEINLSLNAQGGYLIVPSALSERTGEPVELQLTNSSNSGASSLYRVPRWRRKTQTAYTVNAVDLMARAGRDRADVVKIDVEGAEAEVVTALLPLMREHRIGTILLDYHRPVLDQRNIDPVTIHESITGCGYVCDTSAPGFDGYAAYRLPD